MSHYKVKFEGTRAEMEATIDYLGLDRYQQIVGILATCGMNGVAGYWPIRAVARDVLRARQTGAQK